MPGSHLHSFLYTTGSYKHRYQLNSKVPLDKIREFEAKYEITLPNDYVNFLTLIGNGGSGPFYGLEPLENSLFADLDNPSHDSLLAPSKPFIHRQPWNLKFEATVDEDENEEEYEKEQSAYYDDYYDSKHMNGVIAVCNFGCAVSLNLVVNGSEYGNIWTDDRGSENGIYPSQELGNEGRITFLNWYELWLDNSIKALDAKLQLNAKSKVVDQIEKQQNKPWWKRW